MMDANDFEKTETLKNGVTVQIRHLARRQSRDRRRVRQARS